MADKIAKLLSKLPKKDLQLLLPAITQLVKNEDYTGLDIKALKNNKGLLRLRVSNYRVIFSIVNNKQIKIISIARRNERTYKGL